MQLTARASEIYRDIAAAFDDLPLWLSRRIEGYAAARAEYELTLEQLAALPEDAKERGQVARRAGSIQTAAQVDWRSIERMLRTLETPVKADEDDPFGVYDGGNEVA